MHALKLLRFRVCATSISKAYINQFNQRPLLLGTFIMADHAPKKTFVSSPDGTDVASMRQKYLQVSVEQPGGQINFSTLIQR